MVYGLNFNGKHIPDIAKACFSTRLKINQKTGKVYPVSHHRSCDYILQGVCQTVEEVKAMIAQANNGHRGFHVREAHGWYGIYIG